MNFLHCFFSLLLKEKCYSQHQQLKADKYKACSSIFRFNQLWTLKPSRIGAIRSNCMGTLTTNVLTSKLKSSSLYDQPVSLSSHKGLLRKKNQAIAPVARLFGPAIFEASKMKVLYLGVDSKHPGKLPRTYTLTHSDITSQITLAISHTINKSQLQGWYNRLQRDEVVAQWRKIKGEMSLHVHCHISGGHLLLHIFARLRYLIFSKELPVVLNAFVHGDGNLFNNYPELLEALVWVYFHSNVEEFNKVECWGPLKEACALSSVLHGEGREVGPPSRHDMPQPCQENCDCCFP